MMAQRTAVLQITGNVVKSETHKGSFKDREDPTRVVDFDYIESRVLTAEFDAVDVRFPSDHSVPIPDRDELVTLTVEVRPSGGNLKLTVLSVAPAAALARV